MKKWLLLVTVIVCISTLEGCQTVSTEHREFLTKSFQVDKTTQFSGPPVTLFPVAEKIGDDPQSAQYKAAPNFTGSGPYDLAFILFIPVPGNRYENFDLDVPRTDAVRMAFASGLAKKKIPAVEPVDASAIAQWNTLPKDHLALSVTIAELKQDTKETGLDPFIIVNGMQFFAVSSTATLDCGLRQPGNETPLWSGRVSIQDETISDVLSKAADQCIQKSGLVDLRAKFAGERFAKLIADGRQKAAKGDAIDAMDQYADAYRTAVDDGQRQNALQSMSDLIHSGKVDPALSPDGRRYMIQALGAVQDKKFAEAVGLYWDAIENDPWWAAAYFNSALIYAEMGKFSAAIQDMKFYLVLAPEASNAAAAQDKIYDWERRANISK